jgi:hypothetical protein
MDYPLGMVLQLFRSTFAAPDIHLVIALAVSAVKGLGCGPKPARTAIDVMLILPVNCSHVERPILKLSSHRYR